MTRLLVCLCKAGRSFQTTTPYNTRRAMTCIELLVFIVLVACVAYGFATMIKIIPGFWGGLLGVIAGIAFFFLIMFSFFGLITLIVGGIPRLPRCRQGTCRGEKDYHFKKFGDDYNAVCRHGDRYARRGRQFVFITEEGSETPYLVWWPFAGWHKDVG